MSLTELKKKPISELLQTAEQMGIENVSRTRKQDIIFQLLKRHARNGEDIHSDGVLEILQGELRSVMMQMGAPTLKDLVPQMVRRA